MIKDYLFIGLVLFIYMAAWYVFSLVKKRNDVADIAWGIGFVTVVWVSFAISKFALISLVINCLVTIWGLRLAFHIYKRNRNKPEDRRYLEMRVKWKHPIIQAFLEVFLFQGILLFIIALPVIAVNLNSENKITVVNYLGIAVWLIGFYFEVVGDSQLARFLSDPDNKGKIMQSGLWRYTRHPNYFGEITMWWGIYIAGISGISGAYTIIGPLTISYLILFVSGIPLLEKAFNGNPEFEDYKKRTSVFFPLPPKKI